MIEIQGKYTTAKIMIDEIEESALQQIYSMINHPAFTNPIVIQPDTHMGTGSVIGFTMKLTDKVIPNVIGVDIGCSIQSVNITEIKMSLAELNKLIRAKVMFGANVQQKSYNFERQFNWKELNKKALMFHNAYQQHFNVKLKFEEYDFEWLKNKIKMIGIDYNRFSKSIGTVGGGNHFIEVSHSEKSGKWVTVHTGSRNFGKRICDYWQNQAKQSFKTNYVEKRILDVKKIKEIAQPSQIENEIKKLPQYKFPEEQLWLEGDDAYGYFRDMFFAQQYADLNRSTILNTITMDILDTNCIQSVTSVHNYIDFNDFIIRKGAIRSYENELMVIPFNMRDGILLCAGKSNPDWNFSAPHGCGRVLSRSKAKEILNLDDFIETMKDVVSTSVNQNTLDEAPDAYKDCKIIENAIADTAMVVDRLKPILNLKDDNGQD